MPQPGPLVNQRITLLAEPLLRLAHFADPDAGRLVAFATDERDRSERDAARRLQATTVDVVPIAALADVALHDAEPLDDEPLLLAVDADDLPPLAGGGLRGRLGARHDLDRVSDLELLHGYSTSGAREMIFMNF